MESDNKMFAALTHLGVIFNLFGLVIAIVIYAIKGKESPFINYCAKQAIGWQIIGIIAQKILAIFSVGSLFGGMRMGWPTLGGALGLFSINGAVALIFMVVGIIAAIKALNGERYKYPLVGDFIEGI